MATFLQLTNKVLEGLNEVTLTSANFATATGFQADAKNGVNAAILDIHTQQYEWPFNHVFATRVLDKTTNQQFYALPADCKTVDWESFYIQADLTLNLGNPVPLIPISYSQWMQQNRVFDQAALDPSTNLPTSTSIPQAVFQTQALQFGITPVPYANFTVNYEYWRVPVALTNFDDITTIPDQFQYVIVNGAKFYTYMFRENFEQASMIKKVFTTSVDGMRRILVPQDAYMRDTRTGPQFMTRRR